MDWDEMSKEESKKSANQKQESPVVAMFITDRDGMSTLYRGLPMDASYQVSVHLAKRCQRRRIFKISQSETSRLWRPCMLTDQDEMRAFHRFFLPNFGSFSYSVSDFLEISQADVRSECGGLGCRHIGTK